MKALEALLTALDELAPAEDKGVGQKIIADLKADGCHDELEHCRAVCATVYDGLAYGNWPSVIAKL